MTSNLLRAVLALLALTVLCPPAAAQDAEIVVPEELQDFWKRWVEAKDKPGDEEMDRTVRRYTEDAEFLMNILLDDISRKEQTELHHEIRMLAWSLDRVERTERYISRVRFVLDLDMIQRGQRATALRQWGDAFEAEDEARRLRTASAWGKVLDGYAKAAQGFESVGDWEYVVFCHVRSAQIQGERDLRWEQSQFLAQVVEHAAKLDFDEPALEESRRQLEILAEAGIDPDKEKPVDQPDAAAADKRGGLGLESFAAGAEEITAQLTLVNPKKGLPALSYPCFHTVDQFQLWPYTYIEENGPEDFDYLRGARFQPDGKPWVMTRDGIQSFQLDRDGDGEPEVTFTASGDPIHVTVPGVDGKPDVALMFAAPRQREFMFALEANYAPTQDNARLRFLPAYHFETEVLGETWKLFDLNIDGGIGWAYENFDDTITAYHEDDHVSWDEPDGLLVGKGKRAVPWGSVVPVGDRWFRTWSDPTTREIRLKELNLATGQVKLSTDLKIAPQTLVVRESSELLEGAYFEIVPERRGKPVTLPVGTYQIVMGRMSKGKGNSQDQVRIYAGDSQPFEVREGETTELSLGAPFKITFETRAEGDGRAVVGRSLRVFGSYGEEYAMLFDEALRPDVAMRTTEGRKAGKPVTMQQCSIGEWQVNTGQDNILWFPLDEVIPVPAGETWEFQLTLKKHPLLGGPFESDWTL